MLVLGVWRDGAVSPCHGWCRLKKVVGEPVDDPRPVYVRHPDPPCTLCACMLPACLSVTLCSVLRHLCFQHQLRSCTANSQTVRGHGW